MGTCTLRTSLSKTPCPLSEGITDILFIASVLGDSWENISTDLHNILVQHTSSSYFTVRKQTNKRKGKKGDWANANSNTWLSICPFAHYLSYTECEYCCSNVPPVNAVRKFYRNLEFLEKEVGNTRYHLHQLNLKSWTYLNAITFGIPSQNYSDCLIKLACLESAACWLWYS